MLVLLGSAGVFCARGTVGRGGGGLARTKAGKTMPAMAARKAAGRSTRPAGPVPKTKPVSCCLPSIIANLPLWVEDGTAFAFDATNGCLRAIEIVLVGIGVVLVTD